MINKYLVSFNVVFAKLSHNNFKMFPTDEGKRKSLVLNLVETRWQTSKLRKFETTTQQLSSVAKKWKPVIPVPGFSEKVEIPNKEEEEGRNNLADD